MSEFDRFSYSSANVFPLKIFINKEILESCRYNNRVIPMHTQMNWTNRCNFNCEMCSCSEREKSLELSSRKVKQINSTLAYLGCKAYTVTGGGEPTLHKNYDDLILDLLDYDISIGLVTNGTNLGNLKTVNDLVWCRISASDYLPQQLSNLNMSVTDWLRHIRNSVLDNTDVDWAFSYVVGRNPDLTLIERMIKFAEFYEFTHVRLVNDIFIADELETQMKRIRNYLHSKMINDDKVNYQFRSDWNKGYSPCYISLLKPVIGADGYVYPCCGTQYALDNPSRDYEMRMRMGKYNQITDIYERQLFFDGSMCSKCYYNHYNKAIDVLLHGLKHEEFI